MQRKVLSGLCLVFVVTAFAGFFSVTHAILAQTAGKTLRILYSGDVAGYLEPCG